MPDDTRRTDADRARQGSGDESARSAEDSELMKARPAKRQRELMKAHSDSANDNRS